MKLLGNVLIVLIAGSANAQFARFQFTSEQGEWIGQGQSGNIVYTADSPNFYSLLQRWGSAGPDLLTFGATNTTAPVDALSIQLSTHRLGKPLEVGVYEGAERAVFASAGRPGLDIAFQGRGSNSLTGRFEVLDIAYRSTGFEEWTLDRLHVTFVQYSGGDTRALRGSFTYSTVPEPGTFAALGIGLLAVGKRRSKVNAKKHPN